MSDQENNTAVAANEAETMEEPQEKVPGPKTHGGRHVDPDKFLQRLTQFYNSSRYEGTVRLQIKRAFDENH